MTPIDLLIKPHSILQSALTSNGAPPDISALSGMGIAIQERHIVAIDTPARLSAQYQANQTLDLPNHLLMPGLINAQGHALGIVSRGSAAPTDVFAAPLALGPDTKTQAFSDDELFAAAQLAFTEMMLAGTTTCADLSPFSEIVAKAAESVGIHAQISVPVTDEANAWTDSAQEGLERALTLHDTYARHPRIGIALGLPSLAHIDRDTLAKAAMYAEELGLAVQVLLHQSPAHALAIETRHGCTGIELLESVGLLGPNLQAVHVNALDDTDVELLRRYRVGLVRCHHPFEHQMRNWTWMSQEQPVALGSGGYGMNYYADSFQSISAHGLSGLVLATQGAAQVLGLEENIGTLAAGKLADVVALDLRVLDARIHADGVHVDIPRLLTLGRANQAVTDVWIAGSRRINGRQFID
jgi:5-methylthioadenosine/S-adenosylhomocysteine deaminase